MQEQKFKTYIVSLIINGKTEQALEKLAQSYNVETPTVKVGLPKRHKSKALGCYSVKNRTIYVLNSDIMQNPFVLLHEFYHHIRTGVDLKHRGTEKYASHFAQEYIQAYKTLNANKNP